MSLSDATWISSAVLFEQSRVRYTSSHNCVPPLWRTCVFIVHVHQQKELCSLLQNGGNRCFCSFCRWGHSGYKEMHPEEFNSSLSESSDSTTECHKSKKKRSVSFWVTRRNKFRWNATLETLEIYECTVCRPTLHLVFTAALPWSTFQKETEETEEEKEQGQNEEETQEQEGAVL